MELSNDKLTLTLDRIVPSEKPLSGRVTLSEFEARGLKGQRINRVLDTYSFIGESEGYHAQHIASDCYEITGHWVYGDEIVREEARVFGHKVSNVRAVRQSMVTTRPELSVVESAEDEYAAA